VHSSDTLVDTNLLQFYCSHDCDAINICWFSGVLLNEELQLWLYEQITFWWGIGSCLGRQKGTIWCIIDSFDDYTVTIYCFTSAGTHLQIIIHNFIFCLKAAFAFLHFEVLITEFMSVYFDDFNWLLHADEVLTSIPSKNWNRLVFGSQTSWRFEHSDRLCSWKLTSILFTFKLRWSLIFILTN
jgi:hypothetical protein